MAVFPNTPEPEYPEVTTPQYRTLVTDFQSGKEQRRQLWSFPKRSFALKYGALDQSESDIVYNFFNARKGRFETYTFFFPFVESHVGEYVGVGNGSTTVFDLPSKNTDSGTLTVYEAGTTSSPQPTFSSGTGTDGRDQITFSSAPATGDYITADFDGQLGLKMRFNADVMPKELFSFKLYNHEIELFEVP